MRPAILVMLLVLGVSITAPFPAAAVPGSPPGSVSPTGYSAPLQPRPTVVRAFDNPSSRWLSGHRGVDLAAAPGSAVLAAGDGVVRFAGVVAGKPTVSLTHPDGLITTYEPVTATVQRGQRVTVGTPIGTLLAGHPGCPVNACLHWGARRGSGHSADYMNPLALLGAVRIRLKPV